MNPELKNKLLELAKLSIETYIKKGEKLIVDEKDIPEILKKKQGAFVTLHINNNLRGCIGYILPYKPLYETVIENAYNAAFEDPRFAPLSKNEFKNIDIEISVLSVPEKVDSYNDIEIGKHGIILKNSIYQAVFLPQVAPENNWDLETTLQHLSVKAGGSMNLWKDSDTEFQVFTAEIIKENE